MRMLRSAVLIVTGALVIAACGANQQSTSQSNNAYDTVITESDSSGVKMSSLSLIDGTPFSLIETYRARPVALWFWAPG